MEYYNSLANTDKGFGWFDSHSWVGWIIAILIVFWIIFGEAIKELWERKKKMTILFPFQRDQFEERKEKKMIKNIIVLLIVFTAGFGIGSLKVKVVEVERIKEVQGLPYLDMTASDLKHRLEACADTLGLSLETEEEIKEYFAKQRKYYDERKNELDKLEAKINQISHTIWQRGWQEGYREGRKDARAR